MAYKITKSKHLQKYPYFLRYDDPKQIPYKILAKKLGVHPNVLRGMVRAARRNPTIYLALRKMGYSEQQFPGWFARPTGPEVWSNVPLAMRRGSAEGLPGAEKRSEPTSGEDVRASIGEEQEKIAERLSGLSTRSAPPHYTYRVIQLPQQPLTNPVIEEAYKRIRVNQEEKMRANLVRMKGRRSHTTPLTLNEIKAMAEAYCISQQFEFDSVAWMMFVTDMMQRRPPEQLSVEEMIDLFTKPLKEIASQPKNNGNGFDKAMETLGDLYMSCIPSYGLDYDYFQRLEAARKEGRKRDHEALVEILKMYVENRRRRNYHLEMLMQQNREIRENFWKNMNRMF